MEEYTKYLSQKIFLIECEAIKHLNSNNVKCLQRALKEIVNITTGSPSYIKEKM